MAPLAGLAQLPGVDRLRSATSHAPWLKRAAQYDGHDIGGTINAESASMNGVGTRNIGQTVFAAFVIAVGVLFYWWMFHDAGYSSGRYEERAHIEREHYAADAAERLNEDCAALAGTNFRKCAHEVLEAERESQRAESDLAAQWQAADWARWAALVAAAQLIATVVGLIFIKSTLEATWKAVDETSTATRAMERSNEIAQREQRAWVTLEAVPLLVRKKISNGLYIRVDFIARNHGKTPATHFSLETELYFQGPHEDGAAMDAQMAEQVEVWKREYDTDSFSNLLPNDSELNSIWQSYTGKEIKWVDMPFDTKGAHPMLLAAAFYRTISEPDIVQVSWRSWYLNSLDENGQMVSSVPMPRNEHGPRELCVDPFRLSMFHEEYPAPQPENDGKLRERLKHSG